MGYTATDLSPICPATRPVPFSLAPGTNLVTIDLADSSSIQLDLGASVASGPARPGFTMQYAVYANNLSPQVSGPVTMVFDHDPSLVLVSSQGGTVIGPGQISWNLPALGGYGAHLKQVVFMVPVGTPLGTVLPADLSVSNTMGDADPTNDSKNYNIAVTGSYDPNDKLSDPQ